MIDYKELADKALKSEWDLIEKIEKLFDHLKEVRDRFEPEEPDYKKYDERLEGVRQVLKLV